MSSPSFKPVEISSNSVPRGYVCYRAPSAPKMDGTLDDPAWTNAPWTEWFVDIEGSKKPAPRFKTRAKMVWDNDALYIGAQMEEPQVWATLTKNESVIFRDNDFEIFLDPNDEGAPYVEFEMNALNTTWDLLLPHPYRGGGPPLTGWDIHGLHTAVHVDGAFNDPSKPSKGWSVEVKIPWAALGEICHVACPPKDGDQWRINFSRVEWHVHVENGRYVKDEGKPEDNWVWSPQGVVDMHRPETWGVLQFSDKSSGPATLKPLNGYSERLELVKIWEAEQAWRRTHGRFSAHWEELGMKADGAKVEATSDLFEATVGKWKVDQSLKFWRIRP